MKDIWSNETYCSTVESLCCLGDDGRSNISQNTAIYEEYEEEIRKLKSIIMQKDDELNNLATNLKQTKKELNINITKNLKMKNAFNKKSLDQDAHELQIISTKRGWNDINIPSPVSEMFIESIENKMPPRMQYIEGMQIMGKKQEESIVESISDPEAVLEIQEMNALSIISNKKKYKNICQHLQSLMILSKRNEESEEFSLKEKEEKNTALEVIPVENEKKNESNQSGKTALETMNNIIERHPKFWKEKEDKNTDLEVIPVEKEPLVFQKIEQINFRSIIKPKPRKPRNQIQELDGLEIINYIRPKLDLKRKTKPKLTLENIDKIFFKYEEKKVEKPRNTIQELDGLEIIKSLKKENMPQCVDELEISREYDMLLVKPTWNSLQIQGSGLNLLAIPRDTGLENQEVDEFEILGMEKPELFIESLETISYEKPTILQKIQVLIPLSENKIDNEKTLLNYFEIYGQILICGILIPNEINKLDSRSGVILFNSQKEADSAYNELKNEFGVTQRNVNLDLYYLKKLKEKNEMHVISDDIKNEKKENKKQKEKEDDDEVEDIDTRMEKYKQRHRMSLSSISSTDTFNEEDINEKFKKIVNKFKNNAVNKKREANTIGTSSNNNNEKLDEINTKSNLNQTNIEQDNIISTKDDIKTNDDNENKYDELIQQDMAKSDKINKNINVNDIKNVFGKSFKHKAKEIKKNSLFGKLDSHKIFRCIFKTHEDLRQEQFATQLINEFYQIFKLENTGCWLNTYEIISTGNDAGLVEMVNDSVSLDQLKQKIHQASLHDFYLFNFGNGDENSAAYKKAMNNYVASLAGYSLVCYFLQIKDRHNGNILIDNEGHLIHIDFGFLLSNAPGKGLKFENAPFKLSKDMVDCLGGTEGKYFSDFRKLLHKGFKAVNKHRLKISILVEMMWCGHGKQLDCFEKGQEAIDNLKMRLNPKENMTNVDIKKLVDNLISQSVDNWRTKWYDIFQYYVQGIFY